MDAVTTTQVEDRLTDPAGGGGVVMTGRALGEILDDCEHGGLLTTADGVALAAEITRLRAKLARVRELAGDAAPLLEDIVDAIDEQP